MNQGQAVTDASVHEHALSRTVYVVDDESDVRRSLGFFLKTAGYAPRPYLNGDDFVEDAPRLDAGCVLLDERMPGMDGLKVLDTLGAMAIRLPTIMMTGHGDIATAVQAMKLGAIDFIEKPFEEAALLEALKRGFKLLDRNARLDRERRDAVRRMEMLTPRERDVLRLLADGKSNKEAAIELDLSVRTVEMHRATMFDRLDVRTLPEALKLVFSARADPDPIMP